MFVCLFVCLLVFCSQVGELQDELSFPQQLCIGPLPILSMPPLFRQRHPSNAHRVAFNSVRRTPPVTVAARVLSQQPRPTYCSACTAPGWCCCSSRGRLHGSSRSCSARTWSRAVRSASGCGRSYLAQACRLAQHWLAYRRSTPLYRMWYRPTGMFEKLAIARGDLRYRQAMPLCLPPTHCGTHTHAHAARTHAPPSPPLPTHTPRACASITVCVRCPFAM